MLLFYFCVDVSPEINLNAFPNFDCLLQIVLINHHRSQFLLKYLRLWKGYLKQSDVFEAEIFCEYFESWNSNCEEHCIVVFACKLLVSEFPLLYNVFVWNFSDNTVMPDPNSFVQLFTFCRQHLSSVAYLRSKMRKLKGRTLMKLNPLFHPPPQLILPRKQSLRLHYLK